MELTRRNYLEKSMAGAAGIILLNTMISKAENSLIQNGFFFGSSTVLDEARKNILKVGMLSTKYHGNPIRKHWQKRMDFLGNLGKYGGLYWKSFGLGP